MGIQWINGTGFMVFLQIFKFAKGKRYVACAQVDSLILLITMILLNLRHYLMLSLGSNMHILCPCSTKFKCLPPIRSLLPKDLKHMQTLQVRIIILLVDYMVTLFVILLMRVSVPRFWILEQPIIWLHISICYNIYNKAKYINDPFKLSLTTNWTPQLRPFSFKHFKWLQSVHNKCPT